MSYADDLAKDRDKYLRQRNELMLHLRMMLNAFDDGSARPMLKKAREALAKIDNSDPIANAVERLTAE